MQTFLCCCRCEANTMQVHKSSMTWCVHFQWNTYERSHLISANPRFLRKQDGLVHRWMLQPRVDRLVPLLLSATVESFHSVYVLCAGTWQRRMSATVRLSYILPMLGLWSVCDPLTSVQQRDGTLRWLRLLSLPLAQSLPMQIGCCRMMCYRLALLEKSGISDGLLKRFELVKLILFWIWLAATAMSVLWCCWFGNWHGSSLWKTLAPEISKFSFVRPLQSKNNSRKQGQF